MDLTYDINVSNFAAKLRKHLSFVKKRYSIPVDSADATDFRELYGVLVGDILRRGTLKSEQDVTTFFLYLTMNSYCLGTRIAREFFVEIFDDVPNESESGVRKWRALSDLLESCAERRLSYHDVIARKPVRVSSTYLRNNLERTLTRRSYT